MSKVLPSNHQLDALIQSMRQGYGFDISSYERTFLQRTLELRRSEIGGLTVEAYLDSLAGNQGEAEAFQKALRVGYSEFFRDPLTFDLLEQQVIPELISKKRAAGKSELRVWSASCAAGQEAWSLAIVLDTLCGADSVKFPYRIFASDIFEADLERAREGVYNATSMGNVRLKHLLAYFTEQADMYTILPSLRDKVDFSHYDLLDEQSACPPVSLYGDFDLILCCNLLFYYQPEIRTRILNKFCTVLAPGGYFVTSETERGIVSEHQGLCVLNPTTVVFKKR